MNFPSIDIQGSILSTDLLAKIRSEQATFQQGKDFNPDLTNAKLKDEISLAWQEAKGQWTIYKSKLTRLKEGETGTTETRNFWISPILTNLGYNLTFDRKGEELNGKSFPIGYRDSSLDNFPVYVGGYHESLDKRPENKQLRVSPHAMVQEYLNYSEHLYGMVTNGRQLRLLRDASRITRLSYVEFNLEKMMEEDLYSDFVIFYRVLHASRMPKKLDAGADSIMEKYHQEGLEAGSTIRNKLGEAVKGAIKNLANGFINHPNNAALRDAVAAGNINTDEYYRHQLRIIYRLLFLFVIEERNLVYADSKTPETKRFNHIYFNYYSLLRLRKLAKKLLPPEANRHYDLWQSLVSTFSLFEKKDIGEKLGIMSLQGDLFGYHAISNNQYDLHQCYLSNAVLLNIIKSLSYFENDNGVLIAVNYGGLDVEEFGSVYEGLLELKLEFNKVEGSDNYSVNWQKQAGGREFQSHYTPEELVQPLIKHSLEYLIEDILLLYAQKKVNKENTIKALLKLKVCDVACGSGHILLSAARRIALAVARVLTDEEQPNPLSIRKAMKDVVRNCIYGVDKNPLAVELCKIALWLEAYNPGEPLNFLDHHIKCGDAIVGLAHRSELEKGIADEAFKTLAVDDKDIAKTWRDKNVKERKERIAKSLQLKAEFEKSTENSVQETMAEYKTFNQLPETTPDEIERKSKAYKKFIDGKGFTFLKAMADTQCAQFFIPKTEANKDYLMTDADFRLILSGYKGWQDRKVAKATAVALEQRFFHWFIEFPEVFNDGGFDCVLGNPPFLGDKKLKSTLGEPFMETSKYLFHPIGAVDIVTYFFRRIFDIIRKNGFLSLISTNTIAQGNSREGGLEVIFGNGGSINHAVRSMKWPGKAAVEVSLVTVTKQVWNREYFLNGRKVKIITPFLDETQSIGRPFQLKENAERSFIGSYVLGSGFVLEPNQAMDLLRRNRINKNVLFPFINGEDLNNSPAQEPSRWVINFFGWPEKRMSELDWEILDKKTKEEIENRIFEGKTVLVAPPHYDGNVATDFPECYEIVSNLVKPERQRWATDKDGNEIVGQYAVRAPMPERWWIYGEKRPGLYKKIENNKKVLVIALTSKTVAFSYLPNGIVYSHATVVIADERSCIFNILQSGIHRQWVDTYASRMKTDQRYTPSDCFENYPFPQNLNLQQEQQLETIGEAYHEHRKQLMLGMQLGLTKTYNLFHSNAITAQSINDKDKQVASLQKHLEKTANTISFDEAIQGILKLRELHVQMDKAVLDAYGWNDIELKHDFYEVDYLPENDRVRFTIHPDARKEVLKRLLELNHKIHEEEKADGLFDKKKTVSKKSNVVNEPQAGYGGNLFNQE
jgi:type I restriction-modification system DNA methylase subunit